MIPDSFRTLSKLQPSKPARLLLLFALGVALHQARLQHVERSILDQAREDGAIPTLLVAQRGDGGSLRPFVDSLGLLSGPAGQVAMETAAVQESAVGPPTVPFTLRLRGIIGGPPWSAIVVGIAGSDAAKLVLEGDSVGSAKVVRIRANAIDVRTIDSIVTLRLSSAWN